MKRQENRIALTGGIACGKSLVAKFLNELGVETIDADDIVHGLIPDPAERRRIAAEVFGNEAKRKELEARIHPLVKERIRVFQSGEALKSGEAESFPLQNKEDNTFFSRSGKDSASPLFDASPLFSASPLKIAIIPLLFEAHWEENFDIICCVRSERDLQISRMMTTRGYTREEAEARLAAQMPVEEKAEKSHYLINNNGTADELKFKVAEFVGWLGNLDGRR